jgi:transposase
MHLATVTEEALPSKCDGCGNKSNCLERGFTSEVRYEIDIEISLIVTAHKRLSRVCPQSEEFIKGISGTLQYGVNLEALAVSLNTTGMVSINRTHEILSSVFGVPISTGTISSMVKSSAESVKETMTEIKGAILEEALVHFDETGIRVEEKNHWAHVASTENLTYISVENNGGQLGMDRAGILPDYLGIGIHDCWSPYFKYENMQHGLCCAN